MKVSKWASPLTSSSAAAENCGETPLRCLREGAARAQGRRLGGARPNSRFALAFLAGRASPSSVLLPVNVQRFKAPQDSNVQLP